MQTVAQLDLFASPEPVAKPAPEPLAEESLTLENIGHMFLVGRGKPVASAPSCQFCRCTEDSPCGLRDGDKCVLNQKTRCCSKPDCVAQFTRVKGGYRVSGRA